MSKAFQYLFESYNPYWRIYEQITVSKVLKETDKGNWLEREEIWKTSPSDSEGTQMTATYSYDGDYIGDPKTAEMLKKKGITHFERTSDDHCRVSIGFNPEEQKWYGWSHRAIYGFGIGSKVKKGDCAYVPSSYKEYKGEGKDICWNLKDNGECHRNATVAIRPVDPDNPEGEQEAVPNSEEGIVKCSAENCPLEIGKGEWEAKTLDDAKQMAIDFANGVS